MTIVIVFIQYNSLFLGHSRGNGSARGDMQRRMSLILLVSWNFSGISDKRKTARITIRTYDITLFRREIFIDFIVNIYYLINT